MDQVARHMLAPEAHVLAVPAVLATMDLAAPHTADREALAVAVPVALHMMDPVGLRIQGREGHAMRAPVARAIRVLVEPVKGVHRFADEDQIALSE